MRRHLDTKFGCFGEATKGKRPKKSVPDAKAGVPDVLEPSL